MKTPFDEIQSITYQKFNDINELKIKQRSLGIIPGLSIEFDPDEAEILGAFKDDSMSLEDAIEASFDDVEAP